MKDIKKRKKISQITILISKKKNNYLNCIFKNGFILDNEPFRDLSTTENKIFLKDIEKGIIPNELKKEGIDKNNLEVESRKNEVYSKKLINPIINTIKAYLKREENTNNINKNQDIDFKSNNYTNNVNFFIEFFS